VPETRRTPRLSYDEAALVLRRAVELDAEADAAAGGPAGYDPAALEAAAREVGLSPAAVRQAVAELRAGALAPAEDDRRGRGRQVSSRSVVRQRVVDAAGPAAQVTIGHFLRTQMFELAQRSGDRTVYRPRRDLVASLRRGLDFAGTIRLDGLRMITTVVTPADDRTLVRVEAELAASRANAVARGAAAGAGIAFLGSLIGAVAQQPDLIIVSLPVGAALGAGGVRFTGSRWRRQRESVEEALDRMLDRL
jgi:hypothetical protein